MRLVTVTVPECLKSKCTRPGATVLDDWPYKLMMTMVLMMMYIYIYIYR